MTKEDPSGLLSKVVRFVTSPTTNWGDLNQPEEDRDSVYNKQALKEMIERKRRNDFVRRREFDQLRKLRKREALNPPVDPARPSFFQSSMASRIEDRAGTLKKIDEIEAQMSMQWWRAKQAQPPGAAPAVSPNAFAPTRPQGVDTAAAPLVAEAASAAAPSPVPAGRPRVALSDAMPLSMPSSTVSPSMLRNLSTQPGSLMPSTVPAGARWEATQPGTHFPAFAPTAVQPQVTASSIDFGATQAFLPDSQVFVHLPELEEAAIRYANGDVEAAESALLELLRQPHLTRREPLWMALFDLYRSTGQQDRYDSAAIDFAGIFGKSGPVWDHHGSQELGRPRQHSFDVADQAPAYQWIAPPVLTSEVLAALKLALERAASPWLLDWSRLGRIEPAAVEALADLVADWASSRVRLRWQGLAVLDDLLREHTPSGQADTPQSWWRLRMESLRLLGRAEEFELVALDYCVTYELSPPSWQAPYCECLVISGDGSTLDVQPHPGEAMPAQASRYQTEFASTALVGEMSQLDTSMGASAPISVALSGEVTTDIEGTLPVPLPGYQIPRVLVVDCARLVRIDFLAAGSVLNWAAARQAEGTQVQFQHLNRLVAVFFNVIGINEHARVMPRQD